MVRYKMVLLAALILGGKVAADDLFYTLEQEKMVLGADYGPDNIDQLFFTKDIVKKLSGPTRVRMLPRPSDEEWKALYKVLQHDAPLKERLAKMSGIVELSAEVSRPVLRLATDYANYGDGSACRFLPGAIILIGDDEPEFILCFCFKCHDVKVVCRPTKERHEVFWPTYRPSPELETAVFELTKKIFPGDTGLQTFVLNERTRSPGPRKRSDTD